MKMFTSRDAPDLNLQIVKLRKARGMTQKEFAPEIGVKVPTLIRYEASNKHHIKPSPEVFARLQKLYLDTFINATVRAAGTEAGIEAGDNQDVIRAQAITIQDAIARIKDHLKEIGASEIRISLDEETHNFLRSPRARLNTDAIQKKGKPLTQLRTWGGRSEFEYEGSVSSGTVIIINGVASNTRVTADQYKALCEYFRGREVGIGTSFSQPTPGSLGAWLKENGIYATSSYIGSILVAEGYATRVEGEKSKIRFSSDLSGKDSDIEE